MSNNLNIRSNSEAELFNTLLKSGKITSNFPELKRWVDSTGQLKRNLRNATFIYGVNDGFGVDSPVFIRGNYQDPSPTKIPRAYLSALSSSDKISVKAGSGRKELAKALLSEDNPLTARVMVNRIWHHIFGKGLVATVDNFGAQGKLPTHPELLDYLALKFQNEGWSIKKMIRLMLHSNTFKRSTIKDGSLSDKDPTNLLLAAYPLRRIEAEAIRDGILKASGSLNQKMFGPPVATYLTEFMQGRGRPKTSGPLDGNGRRSIYLEVRRNFLEPMMITFDMPIPFSTFGNRNVTNVPAQALIIMNDPFVEEQAEAMAKRLLSEDGLTFNDKIAWIYLRSFGRAPGEDELAKASDFITMLTAQTIAESDKEQELIVWKSYCHSIFNMKEFIYLI